MILKGIKRLLGISDLEAKLEAVSARNERLEKENKALHLACLNSEDRIKTMEGLVNVGVDLHYKGRSWAVVCIAGKTNFVQFKDLGVTDAREVMRFISQYDKKNVTVDAPYGLFR